MSNCVAHTSVGVRESSVRRCFRNSLHVYVQDEQREFIYRSVIDEKESETECVIISDEHPLDIEACTGIREADSDCTHASRSQKRQF